MERSELSRRGDIAISGIPEGRTAWIAFGTKVLVKVEKRKRADGSDSESKE